MNNQLKAPRRARRRGQAIAEYLILTALIAVGSIAVIQVLGRNLKTRLADVSDAIRGDTSSKRDGMAISDEQIKANDLGDFSEAIRDNEK